MQRKPALPGTTCPGISAGARLGQRSIGADAVDLWTRLPPDFAERPVYGKVRYMSPAAQKKKFDVEAYIKKTGFTEAVPAYQT